MFVGKRRILRTKRVLLEIDEFIDWSEYSIDVFSEPGNELRTEQFYGAILALKTLRHYIVTGEVDNLLSKGDNA